VKYFAIATAEVYIRCALKHRGEIVSDAMITPDLEHGIARLPRQYRESVEENETLYREQGKHRKMGNYTKRDKNKSFKGSICLDDECVNKCMQ